MGTNFYCTEKISRKQRSKIKSLLMEYIELVDKADVEYDFLKLHEKYNGMILDILPERVHLGKRTRGCQFLWDYHYGKFFKTNLESIKEYLKDKIIFDENDEVFSLDQFLNDEIADRLFSATPAWQIDGTIYPKDGVVPRSMNRKDGYKVVYEDGYESWSPKDVFERAYKPSETVLDRLKIERYELRERIEKLEDFIGLNFSEAAEKAGSHQAALLVCQRSYMVSYLDVLETRIVLLENGNKK